MGSQPPASLRAHRLCSTGTGWLSCTGVPKRSWGSTPAPCSALPCSQPFMGDAQRALGSPPFPSGHCPWLQLLPEDTGEVLPFMAAEVQEGGTGGVFACIASPPLSYTEVPTLCSCAGARLCVHLPPGGSASILEAGDSRAAPATTRKVPNSVGGTRSQMPSVAPGPAPAPGRLGVLLGPQDGCSGEAPRAQPNPEGPEAGGPGTPQHTPCPSPHWQPWGMNWGSLAPPSTPFAAPGAGAKGKSLGGLAVPGCSSSTALLRSGMGKSREEALCGRPALLRAGADLLLQNINKSLQECEGNLA